MTTFIVTLNLPDTLNFDLSEEDVAKLSVATGATDKVTVSPLKKRSNLPVPNLLETLSKNVSSSPPTTSSSPTTEFPPSITTQSTLRDGATRREFFANVASALQSLGSLEPEAGGRPQYRRKLTQPPSRATSPPIPPTEPHKSNFGPGGSPLRQRSRKMTIGTDKMFSDAKWKAEKQEFGVNGGLINAVRAAENAGKLQDYKWIGTLGMPTDTLSTTMKTDITNHFSTHKRSIPVFISDADLEGHYNRYCKQIIWPTFHYQIPDNPKFKHWENSSWEHYIAVNRAFAEVIVNQYKRGDAIWVNDYHLLLVPKMVRDLIPHAMIGLFLHIAFPSSEVFRCLPARSDLLEGALGSTLIAFQTDEYARHFVQTCSRILSVEAVDHGCMLDDRLIRITCSPIGIDLISLQKQIQEPQAIYARDYLKDKYTGLQILVARDKFDHIRGLKPKMLAFERFLDDHPDWKDKVVFIQVALLGPGAEEDELLSDVNEIVTRTNSKHGSIVHHPMVFRHADLDFLDYLGMLCAADALVITSLREGWNLTSHEYVICQEKDHHGLILSEFIGSASAFADAALLVNPWDIKGMADAIYKVLTMSPEETNQRWEKAFNHVKTHDATNWVTGFLKSLKNAYIEQQRGVATVLPKLNVDTYTGKYSLAEKRLFVVDYEGTLVAWASGPGIVLTTQPKVVSALNDLAADPRNIVYVMSGETTSALDKLFRQSPNIGLIAENGGFIRAPGAKKKWIALAKNADFSWREHVEQIFHYYQERTPGSIIEEKETSLIFHYEDADQRDAERQARECANHINDSCPPTVHAVQGEYFVVAEPTAFTKATACAHLMSELPQAPSFLFVAGNDRTDEDVFKWANALEREGKVKTAVTVSVGARRTEARNYVNGTQAVLGTLRLLASRGGSLKVMNHSQGNVLAGMSR